MPPYWFPIVTCFAPLAYFAYQDWHTQTVSALPLEGWTILLLCMRITTWTTLLAALGIGVVLALFSWYTNGFGSADVLVIIGLTATLGLFFALISLLLACLIGLGFAWCVRARRIPFIPPLLVGGLLALTVQLM